MRTRNTKWDFGILPRQPLQFIMEQITWLKGRFNRSLNKLVRDGKHKFAGSKRASQDRTDHSTEQSEAHEIAERVKQQRTKELQSIKEPSS